MITKEQIELVASRYGISVTYRESGKGGFVVDEAGKVCSSIARELENIFNKRNINMSAINNSYIIEASSLFAA